MSFSQYNFNGNITSVDVSATTNVAGNYYNGNSNNGVGAQLVISGTTLTIDSITLKIGNIILLTNQTNKNENGIYVLNNIDLLNSLITLERRNDFQCIEQLKSGQYLTVGEGTENAGSVYIVNEPLPSRFGIDPLIITLPAPSTADFNVITSGPTPGFVNALTASITSPVAIVDGPGTNFEVISGIVNLNGVASSGPIVGVTGVLISKSGTYDLSSSYLAAVVGEINFTAGNSTINGAEMFGVLSLFRGVNTPTDLSNVRGLGSINLSIQEIGAHLYNQGTATYFLFGTGVTYNSAAGTSSGSAGDPAHCNANTVLKISINGSIGYIPVFASNE
jgi:hypothetical protein